MPKIRANNLPLFNFSLRKKTAKIATQIGVVNSMAKTSASGINVIAINQPAVAAK